MEIDKRGVLDSVRANVKRVKENLGSLSMASALMVFPHLPGVIAPPNLQQSTERPQVNAETLCLDRPIPRIPGGAAVYDLDQSTHIDIYISVSGLDKVINPERSGFWTVVARRGQNGLDMVSAVPYSYVPSHQVDTFYSYLNGGVKDPTRSGRSLTFRDGETYNISIVKSPLSNPLLDRLGVVVAEIDVTPACGTSQLPDSGIRTSTESDLGVHVFCSTTGPGNELDLAVQSRNARVLDVVRIDHENGTERLIRIVEASINPNFVGAYSRSVNVLGQEPLQLVGNQDYEVRFLDEYSKSNDAHTDGAVIGFNLDCSNP